jgi:hypothetical protein
MAQEKHEIEATSITIADDKEVSVELVTKLIDQFKNRIPTKQWHNESWTEQDATAGTMTLLSYGMLPYQIGYEIYTWRDKNTGQVHFHRKYSGYVDWCNDKEKFRHQFAELSPEGRTGLEEGDILVRCYIVRQSLETAYNERYAATLKAFVSTDMDPTQAVKAAHAATLETFPYHDAVVRRGEVYNDNGRLKRGGAGDLKGWVPGESRAHIRALVGALRQAYGEPSAAEQRRRNTGMDITVGDMAELAAAMPDEITIEKPEIQERYLQLQAQNQKLLEGFAKRDDGKEPEVLKEERQARIIEHGSLVHGPPDEPIGEDWWDDGEQDWLRESIEKETFPDHEEIEEILELAGYKTPKSVDIATRELFGKPINDMDELEMLNFLEWCRRRTLLLSKGKLADKVKQIPELKGYQGKLNLNVIGQELRNVILDKTKAGERLEKLEVK